MSSPYLALLALACAIPGALAIFTVQRRHIPGAWTFLVLLLGLVLWSGPVAASVAATQLDTKLFWYKAQYAGIVLLPGTWVSFALQYTGRSRWLRWRYRLLLLIEPAIIFGLAISNAHDLVWSVAGPPDPNGFIPISFGPWYWVGTAYSFVVVGLGTFLLGAALGRARRLYLSQATALLIASLLPLVAQGLYVTGLSGTVDLTPVSFSVSGAAFFWGFLRFGFLDVVPIARGAVVELMTDGLIVVDRFGRVVDVNPTACELLNVPAAKIVGRSMRELPATLAAVLPTLAAERGGPTEIVVERAGAQRWLDVRLSPMRQNGDVVGSLLVIRDATDRVLSQQTLRASEERLRLALAAARMATWDWDLAENRVLWSGETVALFGSAAVEHSRVPRDCLALIHPQDRRQLRRAVVQALKGGGSLELELRIRRSDGSERWLDCRGQVVDYTAGRRRIIGTVMDVTERRAATEALAHNALHDVLTGLANRRLMYQRLEESLAAGALRGGEVGLLVIDLDRFKEVNDTLGHHVGDALLCQVSQRIQSVLEPDSTLGRLGGDEFGVVVPSTDEKRLKGCAERVLRALEAPFVLEGRAVSVGASIGLALAPSHAESAEALLRCADAFMYAAKRGGGGLALASPSPAALASFRAGLDAAVAQAA